MYTYAPVEMIVINCNMLQYIVVFCSVRGYSKYTSTYIYTCVVVFVWHVPICHSMLQYVAVCCSVLQCVGMSVGSRSVRVRIRSAHICP